MSEKTSTTRANRLSEAAPSLNGRLRPGLIYRPVEDALRDRCWNIVVWIIIHYAMYRGKAVAAERMRHEIREALGLPNNLRYYAKRADLAHHGAALGKRVGLGLPMFRWCVCDEHKGKKLVEINETTLALCHAWIAKQDRSPDVVF